MVRILAEVVCYLIWKTLDEGAEHWVVGGRPKQRGAYPLHADVVRAVDLRITVLLDTDNKALAAYCALRGGGGRPSGLGCVSWGVDSRRVCRQKGQGGKRWRGRMQAGRGLVWRSLMQAE